jgi:hypothetical protein
MTKLEKMCEMIGIKGIIHYMESDTHIVIERGGKTYMFEKETERLVIFE